MLISEDMSFYWIRRNSKDNKVCLGFGPYPNDDCSKVLADGYRFANMKLSAMANSFFSYGRFLNFLIRILFCF